MKFDKKRSIVDTLGDTFEFLKVHFVGLFKVLLYIAGPFLLFGSLLSAYIQRYSIKLGREANSLADLDGQFFVVLAIIIIVFSIASVLSYAVVFEYIKYYHENDRTSGTIDEIWQLVKKSVFKYLFASVMVFIIFLILTAVITLVMVFALERQGAIFVIFAVLVFTMFLFATGTVVFLIYPIITFTDQIITQAIAEAFRMVKGHFWSHLITICSILIISYIITLLFSAPNFFIVETMSDQSLEESPFKKPILFQLAFTATHLISTFGSLLVTILPLITLTFQYFNLKIRQEEA